MRRRAGHCSPRPAGRGEPGRQGVPRFVRFRYPDRGRSRTEPNAQKSSTPDLYTSCPSGSGKKFKWCCQPIHEQISRAFEQDAAGQHDTALRIMDEVVAANPGNPEAWGRKAQLLYQSNRVDEAEAALQKAFDLNPRYP